MSHQLKQEYLKAIRERYQNSNRGKKSTILDEFCQVCGYARKYAIAILNGKVEPGRQLPRGRTVKYDAEAVFHLVRLWREMGMPGSTKFKASIAEWLTYDEHDRTKEDLFSQKLIDVSRPQLDRLLKSYRTLPKGMTSTRPASFRMKSHIPIQAKDWNITKPGQQTQGDTVAHCGDTLLGTYANSLTVTDIYSAWTENRALWGKTGKQVVMAIRDIEKNLPFELKGFKSDSGSEFINHDLIAYFQENRVSAPVLMTRSRPYKKDDNCYVEQKNFTHVRELFGYPRLEDPEMVRLMNEIYTQYWCPLQNYFMPTQKLLRKTRIGARIKKEYEPARTPYQRLMESDALSEEQKIELQRRKSLLNPFKLRKALMLKVEEFEERVRRWNTGLIAA